MIQSSGEMEPLDHLDKDLQFAVAMAEETQTMTPVIKHELKVAILERRHRRGEAELPVEQDSAAGTNELTPDEKKKKLKRKEQNRRAAQRCREKKRKIRDQVEQDYILEQQKTDQLQREIAQLKREKAELQQAFEDHIFSCALSPTPNPTPSYEEQTTFTFPPSQPEIKPWDLQTPFEIAPQSLMDQIPPQIVDEFTDLSVFLPDDTSVKQEIPNTHATFTRSSADMLANQYLNFNNQIQQFSGDFDSMRPSDFGL